MTAHLAVHTPMPLMPLTTMVHDMALVQVETNHARKTCCFYGWGEEMHDWPVVPIHCLPHHVVSGGEPQTMLWLAKTLKMLGYQVVVTEVDDAGNDTVLDSAPMLYDDAHSH
jgi:hypothetical protein